MLQRAVILIAAVALMMVMLSAPATFADQKAANTLAVCGCGKVFVPDATTEYLSYGGKQYACCTHACHQMAEKDPAGSAKMWQAAYTKIMSGGKQTREEIYQEIQGMMGLVPSMFKAIPDESLAMEWNLFKQVQFAPGPIPNKYRELIGIGIAASTKCQYCTYFHTQMAKLDGATDAEIEDAIHFAKSTSGWSTYVNGLQLDYSQFKNEVNQACNFVKTTQASGAK